MCMYMEVLQVKHMRTNSVCQSVIRFVLCLSTTCKLCPHQNLNALAFDNFKSEIM